MKSSEAEVDERQIPLVETPASAPEATPANDEGRRPAPVPRKRRRIVWRGVEMSISNAAKVAGIPRRTLRKRLDEGLTPDDAMLDMFAEPAHDPHPANPEQLKPKSLGLEPLTTAEMAFQRERTRLPVIHNLPTNRGDCEGGPRPCPLVRCRYNNYGFVTPGGAYKLNFPNREPWEMPERESCALDVADDHDETEPRTLEETGRFLNLTWVRAHQIEDDAFVKLRRTPLGREIARALAKKRLRRGEV